MAVAGVAAAAGLTPLGIATANAATASASSLGSYLYAGQTMQQGQYLTSSNGQYQLIMQGDGNLVEYMQGHALWNSGTGGHAGAHAVMQGDGNLVVYQGSTPLWSAGTGGHPTAAYYLALQSDANVVIYAPGGSPLWADNASPADPRSWGDTLASNPAPYGQCTYEAEKDFHAFAGVFVDTYGDITGRRGNALDWGANAASHHWTVVTTPEVDSIVVFQPGVDRAGSVGHVAWVLKVSGNQIYVDQMNVPEGNPNPTQQWYTVVSGTAADGQPNMQFILAP